MMMTTTDMLHLLHPPARNLGSCVHYLELNICFDEYNYHDSLQVHLINIEEICDLF